MLVAFAVVQLALSVSAHTIFQQLYVDGVSPGLLKAIRAPPNNSPIVDVDSADMGCNVGSVASSDIINVPAGSTVTAEWHQVTDPSQYGTGDDPIATSHHGPVITYIAKVDNATTTSPAGLSWVKIHEDGYSADKNWGTDRMIANKGKVDFKVPACLGDGHYLLRQEIIALHNAYTYPGAQFYMSCAQIQITGGGAESPAGVSIPGAYKSTDPGVSISIYNEFGAYVVPGPQVFSCGGAPVPPPTAPTSPPQSTDVPPTPPTTEQPSAPTAPPTLPSAPAGTALQWGQCGGEGWTGATACVSGTTCQVINPYYSQCL